MALEGGTGRGVAHGEVILQEEVSGIRLILVGREGNHVVDRSCFHRSQFGQNGL